MSKPMPGAWGVQGFQEPFIKEWSLRNIGILLPRPPNVAVVRVILSLLDGI